MIGFAIENPKVARREKGALTLVTSHGKIMGLVRALVLTAGGVYFTGCGVLLAAASVSSSPTHPLGHLTRLLFFVIGSAFARYGVLLLIEALAPVVEMRIRRDEIVWEVIFRRRLLLVWKTAPKTKRLEGSISVVRAMGRRTHRCLKVGTVPVAQFSQYPYCGDAEALKSDLEALIC